MRKARLHVSCARLVCMFLAPACSHVYAPTCSHVHAPAVSYFIMSTERFRKASRAAPFNMPF